VLVHGLVWFLPSTGPRHAAGRGNGVILPSLGRGAIPNARDGGSLKKS
jgi:hypothetical protein